MSGKLKMVLQCLAAVMSLLGLYLGSERTEAFDWALAVSIWGAVLLTLYSGGIYIQRAIALLRR